MASTRNLRSKKTAVKRKPSEASIFSSITKASNGSSGSNSTVTQESISRPKQRPPKQDASRKATPARPSKGKSSSRQPPSMPQVQERPVNVFEYMVQEGEEGTQPGDVAELEGSDLTHSSLLETTAGASHISGSTGSSEEHGYPVNYQSTTDYQTQHNTYHQEWSEGLSLPGGFHSDSGISVRSSSPEPESPVGSRSTPSAWVFRHKGKGRSEDDLHKFTSPHMTSSRVLEPFDQSPDMSPEAFYSVASRPSFQHAEYDSSLGHLPCHRHLDFAAEGDHEPENSDACTKSTYDLLNSSASSTEIAALKPMYRKFGTLNSRVLLHLQDEIADLESSLQNLDTAISEVERVSEAKDSSEHVGASVPLDWQRKELVGQVSVKLEQYNRALSSYNSISWYLDPVPAADINKYKTWLEAHEGASVTKTLFLHHEQDFIILSEHCRGRMLASERSAMATGCAMLMTILAFKAIPQLYSRLLVGLIIGLAMSYSGTPSLSLDTWSLHEHGRRIALYATAIVVLAIAVG